MNAERKEATYLNCQICGRLLSREDESDAFFSCGDKSHGTDNFGNNRIYMVSSKFNNPAGRVTEVPIIYRRVGWFTRIKRKIQRCLV